MAFFNCPSAADHGKYLICSAKYKGASLPPLNVKAYEAYCPHQHKCFCDGKMHVSEGGKQCYEKKMQET